MEIKDLDNTLTELTQDEACEQISGGFTIVSNGVGTDRVPDNRGTSNANYTLDTISSPQANYLYNLFT